MELIANELLYKTYKQKPVGVEEPVYDQAGEPLFGERGAIHPQSTLKLPHKRGERDVPTNLASLPKRGDCRSGNSKGPVSGIYLKPGPQFFQDYKGPVYHRAPLELFEEGFMCETTKRIGRVTGSDGKLYHIYVCIDGCITVKSATRSHQRVLRWVHNRLDCPLWVTSCSDTKEEGAVKKQQQKPDRLEKGRMKIVPRESEKDSKTKPPDATIVVDGVKYQVKKKGKVKSKNTQDGLYHNKNKPPESRKKLEKALLAWAILAVVLIQVTMGENITQWNLQDNGTEGIQRAMFQRGVNRSLHGIWPEKICTGVPSHLATDVELKTIHGMMDASEKTNYTCCRLQRHEWNKHGWCNWYNIEPWILIMNRTQANLSEGQPPRECAVTCRYDRHSDLNVVTQARDSPTPLTGCKKGKNFSFAGILMRGPCNFEIAASDVLFKEHDCTSVFQDTAHYLVDGMTNSLESARQGTAKLTTWLGKQLGKLGKNLENKSKTWFGAYAASPYCDVDRKLGYIWFTKNCTPACLPKNTKIIGPGKFDTNAEDGKILHEMGGHLSEVILLSLVVLSDFAPETASAMYIILHFSIPQSHVDVVDCDKTQLNLTVELTTAEVIPGSVWNLGRYVCIRPDWWPYETTAVLAFEEVGQVVRIVLRALRDLTRIWNAATTTAFLVCLVKVVRGQIVQGILWLLLITGVQGHLDCKPEYSYAIAKSDRIGLQGAEDLTTVWKEYSHEMTLEDTMVIAWCKDGKFVYLPRCTRETRYLATLHSRALPTSVEFEKLFDGLRQGDTVEMDDNFEFGLCPCDAKPVVRGKYNTTLLNGPAFQMVCPIGWTGTVSCMLANRDTLDTAVVRTYRRSKPFPYRQGCITQKILGEDLYNCDLGGNWTCITGDQVQYTGGSIESCKWCSFKFQKSEGLPHYPIGKCRLKNETGYRFVDNTSCNREGVAIVPTGQVKCKIGDTIVQVVALDTKLGPMPCKPHEIIPSEGPVEKTACTFNYTKTLKNKYFEPRDSYFQQYMLKGEYQYWFDLEVTDHHRDYFAESILVVVVALLGGRYVLWLLVTYMILSEQKALGTQYGAGEVVMMGNLLTHDSIEVVTYFLLLYLLLREENVKKWTLLLFHILVAHPLKSITVILLMIGDVVKADPGDQGYLGQIDVCFAIVVLIVIGLIIARRDPTIVPLVTIVASLRATRLTHGPGVDVAMAVMTITLLMVTYVTEYFRYKRWLQCILSLVSGVFLIRSLIHLGRIETPEVTIPNWRPLTFILLYLISTAVVTMWKVDIAGLLLQCVPILLLVATLWADFLTLILILPTYELVKLYYLKAVKTDIERSWLGGLDYKRVDSIYDVDEGGEGV